MGNLNKLQSFYIHGNRLTGEIPKEWGNMSRLRAFKINGNSISGCLPTKWLGQVDPEYGSTDLAGLPFCEVPAGNRQPRFRQQHPRLPGIGSRKTGVQGRSDHPRRPGIPPNSETRMATCHWTRWSGTAGSMSPATISRSWKRRNSTVPLP